MDNHNTITWPGWETVRVIGRGSFGTVYEIQREIAGEVERAALKHISIPAGEDEIVNLQSEGMDAVSITRTFQDQLNDILNEYKLMRKLNDCPYVVHCDDVMYVQKDTGFGWDVLIKMELLTPITKMLSNKTEISEDKVISLGKDISRALIRCAEHNILHRDIKIQNIFVSDSGQYKLGDFGIAKAKERTSTGTARIGTYDYMAPEIYLGKRYDKTADIYSLGMVMYWLLNNRRMPFLPQTAEAPRMQDRENARMRRLNGEKLPPPVNGSKGLQKIVLKCCAYKPENRYTDPAEVLNDLLASKRLRELKKDWKHPKDSQHTLKTGANSEHTQLPKMDSEARRILQPDEAQELRKKHRKRSIRRAVAVLLIAMLAFSGLALLRRGILQNTDRQEETTGISAAKGANGSSQATSSEDKVKKGVEYFDAGNYADAQKIFTEAADAGNSNAMVDIGYMYCFGYGVEQDYGKAMEWVEKAADAGNADAMNGIGIMYECGYGVGQDYGKAMEWYQKAADAGDADAMYNIGYMYYFGYGVEQDQDKAREWYIKAADAGNEEAKAILNQ